MLRVEAERLGDRLSRLIDRELGRTEIPYAVFVFNPPDPGNGVIISNVDRAVILQEINRLARALPADEIKLPADPQLPTVVEVREDFDIYIGKARTKFHDHRCRIESPFVNPFRVRGRLGRTVEESLFHYRRMWLHRLAGLQRHKWMTLLVSIAGKRLGCFDPHPNHGDVLVDLFREFVLRQKESRRV